MPVGGWDRQAPRAWIYQPVRAGGVRVEAAALKDAYIEAASLGAASIEAASLQAASLEASSLKEAALAGMDLRRAGIPCLRAAGGGARQTPPAWHLPGRAR